jgi:multidrug efflux pump subunit AcrA (membrane-fusion protein)
VFIAGCTHHSEVHVAELSDQPLVQNVAYKDLSDEIPANGISILEDGRFQFEVNIEADDSAKLHVGEQAVAYAIPNKQPIACRVSRVLASVSSETGQSIAWLTPITVSSSVSAGEFIYARIVTGTRRHVLTVSRKALFVSDGKSMVVRETRDSEGKVSYVPNPITVGLISSDDVEITSGLHGGDKVVVEGGIGFLYPDFKANAEED